MPVGKPAAADPEAAVMNFRMHRLMQNGIIELTIAGGSACRSFQEPLALVISNGLNPEARGFRNLADRHAVHLPLPSAVIIQPVPYYRVKSAGTDFAIWNLETPSLDGLIRKFAHLLPNRACARSVARFEVLA